MELAGINSPGAAFVAGLVTSLHCAGMCGPLACMLMPARTSAGEQGADPQMVGTVYHLSRLSAYAALGAIGGALGSGPLNWVPGSVVEWLPWLLVLFFVALALRWERFLPKFGSLSRLVWSLRARWAGRSPVYAAAILGFGTPLLPCGPLYLVMAVAALTGSARHGLEFMIAFGLGTVPLLWVAQMQFQWVRRRLSPLWLSRTRLMLALLTAGVLAWRMRATLGLPGPDPTSFICH